MKCFQNINYSFRKEHGTQRRLVAMLEKQKISVDQGREFGALLTDLLNIFDCLPNNLLAAKLPASGFDIKALTLQIKYLKDCKQRTKISELIALGRKY